MIGGHNYGDSYMTFDVLETMTHNFRWTLRTHVISKSYINSLTFINKVVNQQGSMYFLFMVSKRHWNIERLLVTFKF